MASHCLTVVHNVCVHVAELRRYRDLISEQMTSKGSLTARIDDLQAVPFHPFC